jgi:hypothetical protein
MATARELIDQAIRRLNEMNNTAAPIRWTRPELLVFLNDALFELNLIAADNQGTITITADSAHNVYDLPPGTIAALSVRTVDGYLLRQQVNDIDNEADWESDKAVRLRINSWAPIGLTKILIYPRPLIGTIIYVEILAFHDPIEDVDLNLPIRPEYERAIEDFIVCRGMFKEGGAEFQQALVYYSRFIDAVQELSGRNVIRSLPSWDIREGKLSETSLREGAPQPKVAKGM